MQDFLDELDQELSGSPVKNNVPQTNTSEMKTEENKETKSEIKTETKAEVKTEIKQENNKQPQHPKQGGPKKPHPHKNGKTNKNSRYGKNANGEVRGKFISKFPETKFYLPSLREGYTRFIPVGGNNETGSKNMGMVQYGDDIVIIDCGVQFADNDMHGVNYSIPDVSFLTKYKDQIKGMLITHAHLDHIGSLKHIVPALGMPPIYATKFTLGLIRKILTEAQVLQYATLIEIDAGSEDKFKVGQFEVEYFHVNHSVPNSAGIFIESPGGAKFIHTGDFKIDHTPAIDVPADLERIKKIGERGITMLMSDSTGSTRPGHSMSEKNVGEALDQFITNHTKGRLIIATFSSWISRVQQLVDICEKNDKTIFLSGRYMLENVAIAKELGFVNAKPGTIKKMTPKNTEGIPPHKQVIITTGSQGEEFSALSRMSEGRHNAIEIVSGDTIIFSSSVVPGNEKSVIGIINKLIRLGATVVTKDNAEVHTGGHAFKEEQKIMAELVNARYFMPVFGDLYFRHVHAQNVMEVGVKEENILMIDNGQIIDFAPKTGNVFKSRIKVPLQEIIIDGHGMGTATSHVIKARAQMKESGVLVLMFKADKKTRALIGHIKLETRGLVYLEEVRFIHRMIIKKSREVYENTVKDVPDMDEKDILKIIKTDLEKFLLYKMDREPMIIPMMTEV
jgi:ribonuclease J